jgi:hypothetical protein
MSINCPNTFHIRRSAAKVGLVGGAALAAAMIGAAGSPAAHADDLLSDLGLAAASANPDDPAVFDYSADPTNIFSPVYSITPTGAENVISTDASGDVIGTQDFTVTELGFPVDTFTGGVEYSPVSNLALDLFGSPYVEDVSFTGAPGTVLPDNTGFLVEEFGGGWGNVLEEANITGTSPIIGDFLTTPFGTENITPIVDLLMNYTGTAAVDAAPAANLAASLDPGTAIDPSIFGDLLSSIGL